MITEAIFEFFFSIAVFLLRLLPDVSWSVDSGAWHSVKDILDGVCYFLPLGTIVAIITLIVNIALFRALLALLKLIASFVPFL